MMSINQYAREIITFTFPQLHVNIMLYRGSKPAPILSKWIG